MHDMLYDIFATFFVIGGFFLSAFLFFSWMERWQKQTRQFDQTFHDYVPLLQRIHEEEMAELAEEGSYPLSELLGVDHE